MKKPALVSLIGQLSSRFGVKIAYFGFNYGIWNGKSTYLPIQVSLIAVHKNCPDTNHTVISLRGQFNFEPHPHWSPLRIQCEFSDEHPRQFYVGVSPGS